MKKTLSLLLMLAMVVSLFTGVTLSASAAEKAALSVYTQTGEGEAVLVKEYSAQDLAALSEKTSDAAYVYYKKDAANAVVATELVSLSVLLADAGVSFSAGDSLSFVCEDGPYSKDDFSYGTLSKRGVDIDGAAVPTGFALTWANGSLDDGSAADIAKEARNNGSIRFVCGMTAEEAEAKTAAGNRIPTGVISVTVVGKPVVKPTTQGLKVDGASKTAEIYNISDYNYFKLRDIAALLNGTAAQFAVSFDEETRTVSITTGQAYKPVGGELALGTDKSASCVLSSWKVEVNGTVQDIVAYNLGGNNFFKLRDLGSALGFGVGYDTASRTMLVTSK